MQVAWRDPGCPVPELQALGGTIELGARRWDLQEPATVSQETQGELLRSIFCHSGSLSLPSAEGRCTPHAQQPSTRAASPPGLPVLSVLGPAPSCLLSNWGRVPAQLEELWVHRSSCKTQLLNIAAASSSLASTSVVWLGN